MDSIAGELVLDRLIQLDILVSRGIPAEIAFHTAQHELFPSVLVVAEHFARFADDMEHIMRVVAGEGETVAGAEVIHKRGDGIPQAAGFADNRNGAIAQGNHLCKAARLALGGHPGNIRSRRGISV